MNIDVEVRPDKDYKDVVQNYRLRRSRALSHLFLTQSSLCVFEMSVVSASSEVISIITLRIHGKRPKRGPRITCRKVPGRVDGESSASKRKPGLRADVNLK